MSHNPYNTLKSNQVHGFENALQLWLEQHVYEAEIERSVEENPQALAKIEEKQQLAENQFEQALKIYRATVLPAIQAAANQLREKGLTTMAEALESSDWSKLAVE